MVLELRTYIYIVTACVLISLVNALSACEPDRIDASAKVEWIHDGDTFPWATIPEKLEGNLFRVCIGDSQEETRRMLKNGVVDCLFGTQLVGHCKVPQTTLKKGELVFFLHYNDVAEDGFF